MRGWIATMAMGMAMAGAALAQAADWRMLTGPEIGAALTGRTLEYGDKWQDFRASGRTLYHSGRESWGYWEVRGDRYCSQWPPSDLWTCYAMAGKGDKLRFIGPGGDVSEGQYRE